MKQNDPFILQLCRLVEHQCGRRIERISDAEWLAKKMKEKKLLISPHTLARMFGIVKPFRNPYPSTLDMLAVFAGYYDWKNYCENQPNLYSDPNYFLTEESDGFSLSLFEIALANHDYGLAVSVLQRFNAFENDLMYYSVGVTLGNFVRGLEEKEELLKILAGSRLGRTFFYECFVDEDNPGQYFSLALINYYLPLETDPAKKLFAYGYLITHEVYHAQIRSAWLEEFIALAPQLDLKKLSYHELSRYYECMILFDGFAGKLEATWQEHLSRMLQDCNEFIISENCWLIYRFLRALLYFGNADKIQGNAAFNKRVEMITKHLGRLIDQIPNYLIQLYWLLQHEKQVKAGTIIPKRINQMAMLNDSREKLAIEVATAYYTAEGRNKELLRKNLHCYCLQHGFSWLLNLFTDQE